VALGYSGGGVVGLFGKSRAQQVQEATEQVSAWLAERALAVPETLAKGESFPRESVNANMRLVLNFCYPCVADYDAPKDPGQNAGVMLAASLTDMATSAPQCDQLTWCA